MAPAKGHIVRIGRFPSSADPYREVASLPEPALCSRCGAVWRKGKWSRSADTLRDVLRWSKPHPAVCPACRRIQDSYPGGVVSLQGSFLTTHRQEILNRVRNEEAAARKPLDRIMTIEEGRRSGLVVHTTSERLARRIGRAVQKAYGGTLQVRFAPEEKLVRVTWRRDTDGA